MASGSNVHQNVESARVSTAADRPTSRVGSICESACPVIGRVLLSLIFIASGLQKIMAWDETAASMRQEGMLYVPVLLVGAIICELAGGLAVMFGVWPRLGAAVLIIFLIPTTIIFHDFWAYTGAEQQNQMMHFAKNLTIWGGLWLVLGYGADRCSPTKRPPEKRT